MAFESDPASSSRHDPGQVSFIHITKDNKHTSSRGNSQYSDMIVTPRRDKGKGKMRYLPELPEEVWQRVWAFYYAQCASDWKPQGGMQNALTPLLLSSDHTRVAFPVLYAHPIVTYKAIPSFLKALTRPSPWVVNYNPPSILVRHLTICASSPSQATYPDSMSNPVVIHPLLPQLFASLPRLLTIHIKDTLILHSQDANTLFNALRQISPSKARLEFRMWDLTESPFGPDLIAATLPSIHSSMSRPLSATTTETRTPSRVMSGLDLGRHAMQEQWRDALWRGVELDLPPWWIDIPKPPINPTGAGAGVGGLGGLLHGVQMGMMGAHLSAQAAALGFGLAGGGGGGGWGLGAAQTHLPAVNFGAGGTGSALPVPGGVPTYSLPYVSWTPQHSNPLPVNNHHPNLFSAFAMPTNHHDDDTDMDGSPAPDQSEGYHYDGMSETSESTEEDFDGTIARFANKVQGIEAGGVAIPNPGGSSSSTTHLGGQLFDAAHPSTIPQLSQSSASSSSLASLTIPGLSRDDDTPQADGESEELYLNSGAGSSEALHQPSEAIYDPSAAAYGAAVMGHWTHAASSSISAVENDHANTLPSYLRLPSSLPMRLSSSIPPPVSAEQQQQGPSSRLSLRSPLLAMAPTPAPPPPPAVVDYSAQVSHTRFQSPGQVAYHLAHTMRRQLLQLITEHWSPTIQALSVVAFDPLATLIVRSPAADLWANIPIPHIRIHLPRGINSLAIFKGASENARDRKRNRRSMSDTPGTPVAGSDDGAPEPTEEEARRVVGGDGYGGELVHDETRLFEIEVNTMKEMGDEMWESAGGQLPPQLCRMLVGEAGSSWDAVSWAPSGGSGNFGARGGSFVQVAEAGMDVDDGVSSDGGESGDDYAMSECDEMDVESGDDEAGGEGGLYDRAAAEEQARRVKEKKAAKAEAKLLQAMEG